MRLIKKSPEIYQAVDIISSIGSREIELLTAAVAKAPLKRARINLHPNSEDGLHEMFIAIQQGCYIRPHKHPNKSEAFHVVHGAGQVVIFSDAGEIQQVVHLEAHNAEKPFYYRMSTPYFHTVIVQSDLLVIHEITNGPFVPGATVFAPFAPDESHAEAVAYFQAQLCAQISAEAHAW